MQPLVSLVLCNFPSLYPSSFWRNDFFTLVSPIYGCIIAKITGGKPPKNSGRYRFKKRIVAVRTKMKGVTLSLSTVVLRIGMGLMPTIVDLWGYDGQNSSSSSYSSRSTPITQKGTKTF